MADTFRCTIVTPKEAVLDEDVSYATFPSWDGQHGVMHGQSPLLARLGIGSMRVDMPGGASRWYLVEGGFAQIGDDTLTILTERATAAEDLPHEGIDEALAEANARAISGGVDRRKAEADQERAISIKRMTAATASGRGGA